MPSTKIFNMAGEQVGVRGTSAVDDLEVSQRAGGSSEVPMSGREVERSTM